MAELIEVQEDLSGTSDLPTSSNEAPAQADNASQEQQETVIPEKYKGKSLDEIVKMHQEAEKLIGRQAQEVGEVRRLADDLIKQQLNTNKQDTQPSVEDNEIDYFADPDKAVNRAVENNPIVRQLKQQAEEQKLEQGKAQLAAKFPDFQTIVNSDDFLTWVKGSKVRIDLFTRANSYEFECAEELLKPFTAIKGMKAQHAQKADDALVREGANGRTLALKSATVQKGGTGEISKPV